jgi:hypothetical protein
VQARKGVQLSESRLGDRSAAQEPDELEGYPVIDDVVAAVLEVADLAGKPVRRIEINAFANGEATYQVWRSGSEEADGGALDSV